MSVGETPQSFLSEISQEIRKKAPWSFLFCCPVFLGELFSTGFPRSLTCLTHALVGKMVSDLVVCTPLCPHSGILGFLA